LVIRAICDIWVKARTKVPIKDKNRISRTKSYPALNELETGNSVTFRFGSVRFGSLRFASLYFGSLYFGSLRFTSVRFTSVRFALLDVNSTPSLPSYSELVGPDFKSFTTQVNQAVISTSSIKTSKSKIQYSASEKENREKA
jgi:hypothetical protein